MPDTYEYIREGDWSGVQRLVDRLNQLSTINQIVLTGRGAPTGTPTGRAIYIRSDGGAATTLYVWEGAAWVGK